MTMAGAARRNRSTGPPHEEIDFRTLVADARAGDEAAWEALVNQLSRVVWKTIGNYRLSPADQEDAFASTFFRLFDRIETIIEPRALPGWIATTARNEVRALLRAQGRAIPMESLPLRPLNVADIDERLLDDELVRAAVAAFAELPVKAQALLRALTAVPPLSYAEISALLDLPHGSIGPNRATYLRMLRAALAPYLDGGDDA